MRNIVLGFFLCVLCSCGSDQVTIPSDIIPQEKMMNVLMDIHIAEAGIKSDYSINQDSITQLGVNYYDFIFRKHQVSKEDFKKSFLYYSNHPELLEGIYQKMIEEMSKKETEITKRQ
jgi:hypothetical protein